MFLSSQLTAVVSGAFALITTSTDRAFQTQLISECIGSSQFINQDCAEFNRQQIIRHQIIQTGKGWGGRHHFPRVRGNGNGFAQNHKTLLN